MNLKLVLNSIYAFDDVYFEDYLLLIFFVIVALKVAC